ncbi:MAG: hypothetical protein JO092_08540 [Candidatus Eremiobacteraeota bacterium]|nr:hypothetical protein [Candidatus Eremiobacteraeota bacterium]
MSFLPWRRARAPAPDPALPQIVLGAMREDRERFAGLDGVRALVYFPHGFGDWVHLGSIAPLLEASNTYAVTRFGDDFVALMEGNRYLTPLFSGVRDVGDGSERGARHFGLALRGCNGGRATLSLPPPLDEAVMRFAPEVLLWTDYPETEGRTPYPFHTKARNLARLLVRPERLQQFDLSQPLVSTIDFAAPLEVQQRHDDRVATLAPPGTRLCIISRAGATAARKAWGHGAQAQALVANLRAQDQRWRFVSLDEDSLGAGCAGFRELFGDLDEPFARSYKALLARTDLVIGVPSGPLHAAMARGGIPIVGLWRAHHPDWYDEPNAQAMHLVGRYVRDRGFHRRPATRTKPASLQHRIAYLDSVEIPLEAVVESARQLTS